MTVIVLFRRWHLNLCFLDIELFQKSWTSFANNPLAMVRDKTFLNIIRNFNFGRRIGQIPVQHRKGFKRIFMGLDIHCISDLITEIHVGKGIRELVTMLIVIESQFIIAVHQAVHREQALINKRQKVVFQSHIVASKLLLKFRTLLKSDRIKSLTAKQGTRSLSHLLCIGNDIPHTHHEGIVFFKNGFAIHPSNKSILVSNGITPRKKQGTARNNRKQSVFHKVLMNMCA